MGFRKHVARRKTLHLHPIFEGVTMIVYNEKTSADNKGWVEVQNRSIFEGSS